MSPLIRTLDLSAVCASLVRTRGWTPDRLAEAVQGYREYLNHFVGNPHSDLHPTPDVDAVWHEHILYTQKYRQDCQAIFGYFLDHFPDVPVPAHQTEAVGCDPTCQENPKGGGGGDDYAGGKTGGRKTVSLSLCNGGISTGGGGKRPPAVLSLW